MAALTPYVLIAISNVARAAVFREVAAESLRLDVTVVRDGEDAVQEMTKRGTPALLIVDLSLARVDGFTIVRKLRRTPSEHETQVIVVSAHESLRVAARELSPSLGISGILPVDAEKATVREVIFSGLDPARDARTLLLPADPAIAKGTLLEPDEIVDRAVLEIRRRFGMPIGLGYLKVGEQESLAVQTITTGSDFAISIGDMLDVAVLRQVADGTDPLVVPDLDDHPVFGALASRGSHAARGFAAVPAGAARESLRAALCVFDTQPVVLSATDVDALATFGRRIGAELDRAAPAPAPPQERKTSIELPEDVEALQHLASTDPLTGIANRRGGEKHIASEISRAKRERRPLSCILIDIDRFKAVNDTYGHQAGDQLLRDVSALLRKTIRAYDILVRWGGEEFLLVLPGAGIDVARSLADRLRIAVQALDTHGIGPVTISAGAAEFQNDYDFASTLRTADRRLYQAKAAGRNCVV